jgi:type I restriction enzyme S subunit
MTKDEWKSVELDKAAALNPRLPISLSGDDQVSFVPMSAVSAETSDVTEKETRRYSEVSKGYTPFVTDDVLVAKITPCFENGKIALARLQQKAGFGSTEFHVIRALPDKLEPRYLLHFMRQSWIRVAGERRMTGSGGQRRVPENFLAKLEIPLPPLAEQRRIAEVLDRAEVLRAKRRAALAELDSLTQSLFLDLFGDPVTNPKWPEVMVSDFVAGFESGKSIVADDEDDTTSPYRVLKVSAVTSLEFRPEQSKAMPPDYSPPPSHFVRTGDLLFSRANTAELIGATAYVASTPANLLLPDKLWRFVWHKTPKADPHFVRFLFQQPKFRREIGQRASGTSGSMKNISQEKVLTIKVGLPPIALQQEFARRVGAVETLKAAQRTALAEQDALFATLQHRAFKGEL